MKHVCGPYRDLNKVINELPINEYNLHRELWSSTSIISCISCSGERSNTLCTVLSKADQASL